MVRFSRLLVLGLTLAVTFSLLMPYPASADELYARIRGTVSDQTGASVPGVTVTATNTGTGLSKSATTGPDGAFELLNLPIGTYNVAVVKTSFKSYTATGITLTVNQIYVLTIKLEVGQVTQQVVVEAAPVQVEATSMQLGTVITGQQIVDMPLNGRNWIQLQQIQAGVVGTSDRFTTNFATNGSQSQQNSYLINGTDSNDLPLNTPLVIPSPDAIAEFQLITNTINPEYGRNSGAIVNAVIKSGTNHFHGDGFDFYRDTSMNARNFFAKKPQIFHQNQFGGTIGGPFWKDHTFGFFSYQGTRARQPDSGGNVKVFSTAERGGNFFELGKNLLSKTAHPAPIPLFGNAESPCPVSGGSPCPAGTTYGQLFNSVPTAADAGVIPTQDFNKISVNLMNTFIPTPNVGHNFQFNPVGKNTADQYVYRIDHTFNQHDSIWFYNFIQTNPTTDDLPFTGSTLPGFGQVAKRHLKQYTAAWSHTFNGTTLNELRFGYTRFNFVAVEPQKVQLPSSFGWQITPQDAAAASVPRINVSGFFTLGFSNNGPQPRLDQTYQATDNFSKVYGKHTLKMGFEGRRFSVGNPFFFSNNGVFSFSSVNPFSTGNAGADFLLGLPNTYAQSSGGFIDGRAYQMYSYIQDQFKIKPNLTLTYGIGHQIDTPLDDFFNGGESINCFRPFQQSKIFASAPVGLNFPGDPTCNSAGYTTHYNQFGPRLGFAWSPNFGRWTGGEGKTSIRGGYGIYYNRSEEELLLQNLTAPPFSLFDNGISDVGGHPSFSAPFVDVACINGQGNPIAGCVSSNTFIGRPATPTSIANKYPFIPPKPGSTPDFTLFEPMSLNIIDPNFRSPYAENFNLTIQRELPGRMILSVAYVGAVAHHLISETEINHIISPAACFADPACNGDPADAVVLGSQQSNFPFAGLTFASLGQQSSFGNSNYNALQVTLNKNMSHGLQFLAAYTYGHSLDTGSSFENSGFGGNAGAGLNPFNFHQNYGDSAFDARHRLVVSYIYNIPSLQHIAHWIPSRIASGWRFGGITTFQTGFPIYVFENSSNAMVCSGNWQFYQCADRPNQVAAVKLLNPRTSPGPHSVFNQASFVPETLGQIGNTHRGAVHALGINNWDFQFSKDTRITESTSIELRVELFNMWNHTQFDPQFVDNDITSSTFGQVFNARAPRIAQLAAKFIF